MKRVIQNVFAVIATLAALDVHAAGELMIHPTRVVLEGANRTAQLDLINSGTETITYRISVARRRMTEDGRVVAIDKPAAGERFADEMIRFSPRQVVLRPGVAQAVRLQLRKPADLPDGEYRIHMLFQALPPARPAAAPADAPGSGTDSIDIHLTPVFGASIPIIVRHGQTTASVAVRDLQVTPVGSEAVPTLSLAIARSGTRSVYGDLIVLYRSRQGSERVVGRANGMAIYVPNGIRRVTLPLADLGNSTPAGELRVTFEERPEQKGRVQAEARLRIN